LGVVDKGTRVAALVLVIDGHNANHEFLDVEGPLAALRDAEEGHRADDL
jgi:hypothetical protein